jgi:putative tryptophan/tyrosine transport system substrate-binding protein
MSSKLNRRALVGALAVSAAAAWPRWPRAQRARTRVIGFLGAASAAGWAPYVGAFRQQLAELGFAEGKNLVIEFRFADGRYDRLPALAADLVRHNVDVLVATGGAAGVRAAIAATKTIPIVFTSGVDPVEQGFVDNLSRPGGNATGVTMLTAHLPPKRLEILHEIVPRAAKIALLVNPANPATPLYVRSMEDAARSLFRQVFVATASTREQIEAAFTALAKERPGGLLISTDPFFDASRAQMAKLILQHGIPTIQGWREDTEAGGLMSYGPDLRDSYRVAAGYTAKILEGASPAHLPIQQSSRVELVINLKTAKALGITLPAALLARADEVIE